MQFLGEPLNKATKKVVADMQKLGGLGGVIALDRKGNGGCYGEHESFSTDGRDGSGLFTQL